MNEENRVDNIATAEPLAPVGEEAESKPDQLRLFDIENPLKSRFTSDFFKQIPTSSGVYWMHDQRGQLLYIGKAKNLRKRLRSYRNGAYARHSSKTRRLLLQVTSIDWEELPNETAALLRENEFLRALKPPFNVANTNPETYLFFGYRSLKDVNGTRVGLELRLMFDLKNAPADLRIHGAFKGLSTLRRGHAALARWLWAATHENCDWPPTFARRAVPLVVRVPVHHPEVEARLDLLLSGWCALPELVLPEESPSGFMQSLWYDDQIRLASLFSRCARHLYLRAEVGRATQIIAQAEVDDVAVLVREIRAKKANKV